MRDVPISVEYEGHSWEGVVRADPVQKREIVVENGNLYYDDWGNNDKKQHWIIVKTNSSHNSASVPVDTGSKGTRTLPTARTVGPGCWRSRSSATAGSSR